LGGDAVPLAGFAGDLANLLGDVIRLLNPGENDLGVEASALVTSALKDGEKKQ
jgi:hypothetical protein